MSTLSYSHSLPIFSVSPKPFFPIFQIVFFLLLALSFLFSCQTKVLAPPFPSTFRRPLFSLPFFLFLKAAFPSSYPLVFKKTPPYLSFLVVEYPSPPFSTRQVNPPHSHTVLIKSISFLLRVSPGSSLFLFRTTSWSFLLSPDSFLHFGSFY